MSNFKMDDYVPVQERIEAFYAKHPLGSLQSEIVELTPDRVTVKAFAYRAPDDPQPGIGHSSLEIPGSTSFTRGSEIENAETSAWGRAIAALGFEVKRGVASREEVRNKQPDRSRGPARAASTPSGSAPVQPARYRREELANLAVEHNLDEAALKVIAAAVGVKAGEQANEEQIDAIIDVIRTPVVNEPPAARAGVPDGVPTDPADVVASEAAPPASDAPPPKPGSDAYRLLPSGVERAAAKVYWEAHPEPDEPTLAEQLQAGVA